MKTRRFYRGDFDERTSTRRPCSRRVVNRPFDLSRAVCRAFNGDCAGASPDVSQEAGGKPDDATTRFTCARYRRAGEPAAFLHAIARRAMRELRTLADWTLRRRLEAVRGVAKVEVFGGDVQQYQILVSPQQLQAYQVSLDEVETAARNATAAAGP